MIITWTIESLSTASESMRSRGSSLRGRSAFSIYRFDNRDRAFVVALFSCITLTAVAVLLHQTYAVYDPQIIIPPITAASVFFYIFYAVMCLMPMGLEIWTEYNFERARQNMAAFPD